MSLEQSQKPETVDRSAELKPGKLTVLTAENQSLYFSAISENAGKHQLHLPGLELASIEQAGESDGLSLPESWGKQPEGSDKNVVRTEAESKHDTKAGVLANFKNLLEKSRVEDLDKKMVSMEKSLDAAEKRLEKLGNNGYLYDASGNKLKLSEQMSRVYAAINMVLESKNTGPLSSYDRANWAASAAAELADPQSYARQGRHNTCVLRSLANQRLQAGDPAAVLEESASVLERGGAFSGSENGIYGRIWTGVNAWSLIADRESRSFFDPDIDKNRRSYFGQTSDAFTGQVASDLQSNRDRKLGLIEPGSKYLYVTANAIELGASTHTGEGTFLISKDGKSKYVYNFVKVITPLDQAELNQHMSSQKGAVFVDQKLAYGFVDVDKNKMLLSDKRPPGYDNVELTAFKDTRDLKARLESFQKMSGKHAQTIVRAEFLPGDVSGLQGLHSLLLGFDAKSENVELDNNWDSSRDLSSVTDGQIDAATNPDYWALHKIKYEKATEAERTAFNKDSRSRKRESVWGQKPEGSDLNVLRLSAAAKAKDNFEGVLANFETALKDARLEKLDEKLQLMNNLLKDAEKLLLEKEISGHLNPAGKGTAAEQMARVYAALNSVLESKGELFADRQVTTKDRANFALSAVAELADPLANVNQGDYFSCALRSLDKQRLTAGDPASVIEEAASALVRGGAFTGTAVGIYGRNWTSVEAVNLIPEGESLEFYSQENNGKNGKRSYFGQVRDSLNGSVVAELRTAREARLGRLEPGSKYVFSVADPALVVNPPKKPVVGQALYRKDADGSLRLLSFGRSDPDTRSWDIAELNQHMSGKAGLFAHGALMRKPPGYEKVEANVFNGPDDFKKQLQSFSKKYGQPAQLALNLSFLRGEDGVGAFMHVMNAGIAPDGSVYFDNNVGTLKDYSDVSDHEIDRATNPFRWRL